MRNIKIFLLLIIGTFIYLNVDAKVYPELNKYDLNNWQKVELELDGSLPMITDITETQDHNYLMLALYKESNELIPGVDSEGNATSGTWQQDHSKIIKYDNNFNKIFEKNFYVLLNSSNPNEMAPTTGTTLNGIMELKDGSFITFGYTFGLTRENYSLGGQDDNFDAIYARFDNDGNELYRKHYYNQGVDQAIGGVALENGGYVIKYYYVATKISATEVKKPTDFETNSEEKFYYVVYDSNNQIIDSFSEAEEEKLNQLMVIDKEKLSEMKYEVTAPIRTKEQRDTFKGLNFAGNEIIKSTKNHSLLIRDSANNTVNSLDLINKSIGEAFLFFNDNSFLIYDTLYDENFNKISEFYGVPGKNKDSAINDVFDHYFVASDGTIIAYEYHDYHTNQTNVNLHRESGNLLFINRPISQDSTNNFDANFIIGGKKINYNLGTFVENDRTYINLNNLCSAMNCTYTRSSKNNNQLIIRFDILKGNAQIPENFQTYRVRYAPTYTITHEIGSKVYKSYFEIPHGAIFILRSPTFKSDSVDVTSKEINGQVYVPLRFISEALGRYVEYIPEGEDGKPTITISAQGEGEFYNKYSVGISYSNLNQYEVLTDDLEYNDEVITLTSKPLYAYSLDKANNTVINKETTIFYPFNTMDLDREDHDENSYDLYNTSYLYDRVATWDGIFVARNNSIHKEEFTNAADNAEYYKEMVVTTVAISNIEGYPFIRMINLK